MTTTLVKAATDLVKVVPEEDRQERGRQLGKTGTTVATAVNIVLLPLRAAVWGYERLEAWLGPKIEAKLRDTPPEQIVAPPAHVAVPALEAARSSEDSDDLRDLYASLLATAMQKDKQALAHPAFAQIIRQLNPDEARLLRVVSKPHPLIHLHMVAKYSLQTKPGFTRTRSGFQRVLKNFGLLGVEAGCTNSLDIGAYLDNLARLGVIELPEDRHFVTDELYRPLEEHPRVVELSERIKASGDTPKIVRRGLWPTEFGLQLCWACGTHVAYP